MEDDDDIRLYMAIVLERAGFTTVAYDNGLSALHAAQQEPADLFVLDRRMPGMDGEQLCRALRADPRVATRPIMMISAETVDLATVAGEAGADAYLPKPFSRSELLTAVEALLARDAQ